MITRIAPTPSGFLHKGNIFSFLFTWLLARVSEGKIVLRIDDLDAARKREEYLYDIFKTLNWLGIDWDIGPEGPDEFELRYSQHKRIDLYLDAISSLEKEHAIYACDCSRKEIRKETGSSKYPGTCRAKGLEYKKEICSQRFRLPDPGKVRFIDEILGDVEVDLASTTGDFVIRRKDGLPSYQLSSVLDDRYFGVDTIVRGTDLVSSTASQLLIAEQLGLENFTSSHFYHHGLITDSKGRKLSKSAGDLAIRDRIKSRSSVHLILSEFAGWMGWKTTDFKNLSELLNYASSTKGSLRFTPSNK